MQKRIRRSFFTGMPFIFLTGALSHFIYELSGKNIIAAALFPVNESVWEHLKLALSPVLVWYFTLYFINKGRLCVQKWCFCALICMCSAMLVIPLLFYFLSGAFGLHSVTADILIFAIAVILGQFFAFIYYKKSENHIKCSLSLSIVLIIIIIFSVFSFYPPRLPLFYDIIKGGYGLF